ncbi:F-box only protein 47-like [Antedon mediterranea]|uniref:F-box only protein 47-like n=1 Tax=Antedon mediterranea TaxID=105859 RepID=UPI003AF86549
MKIKSLKRDILKKDSSKSSLKLHTFECRRSKRIERRVLSRCYTKLVTESVLGYFEILPAEIQYHIMKFLSVEELSILSLVSKAVRDFVLKYMLTPIKTNQFYPRPCDSIGRQTKLLRMWIVVSNHFKNLGLLVKRATCLFPTKERLKIMEKFFSQLAYFSDSTSHDALSCYGSFLFVFVKGWEEKECHRAFTYVSDMHNFYKKLLPVLSNKPGFLKDQELLVRCFYRCVFLDRCENSNEFGVWLSFILRSLPIVYQARLIFILYGPLSNATEGVNWNAMSEDSDSYSNAGDLADLALAIKALFKHKSCSDDDIISILEELTSCPKEWLMENTSYLLMLCGESICYKVLGSKAINGKMKELGRIITSFAVVFLHEELSIHWVVKLVLEIAFNLGSTKEVGSFFTSIMHTFSDCLMALHTEGSDAEIQSMLRAQSEMLKEFMLLSIKSQVCKTK